MFDMTDKVQLQLKPPLRTAFAQWTKELIWRWGIQIRPTQRPIAIYASRRSGSSLLMETICVNPGIAFSDQPFGLYTASSSSINRLPIFPYGQIAFPDADEEVLLRRYLADVLAGRIRPNFPWKFWREEFHFRNQRLCLKITDAKAMIDWIANHFEVDTVVMTRHPIAQALSVAHVGWYPTGKGLLRNPGFVEAWLDCKLESFSWDLYRHGSELEWRILDWALENLPMLRLLPERPEWLYISYEHLLCDVSRTIEQMEQRLQLPARARMIARITKPSRSTRRESSSERQRMIAEGDREALVSSWQPRVDANQQIACWRVLERFEIDMYSPSSPVPNRPPVPPAPTSDQELGAWTASDG